jgi:integrase
MARLSKRLIDSLKPVASGEMFVWDDELRGFGLRMKSTGVKTYIIQYRNADGLTRRLVLGKHGVLAPEQARRLALQKLASVSTGADPSAERHAQRAGFTVTEVCDWYLEEATSGRLLGRSRRAIKPSSIKSDRGRIDNHIKPLIGARAIRTLTLADIERMQADIARGKTTKPRSGSRGGSMKGGQGVAGRTTATLRAVFGHAKRWRIIAENPALGVRQLASEKRTRRLSEDEITAFGIGLATCASTGEPPVALAALRLMLLTGLRRMEVLGLRYEWMERAAINFPDTKSGPQTRAIGREAVRLVEDQRTRADQEWVFPSDRVDGHFVCVEKTLRRVCAVARIEGVTPHTLRHTFASVAADQGFSELTIAGLLGHAAMGVTQRYIHLDKALVVAANDVANTVTRLLAVARPRKKLAA